MNQDSASSSTLGAAPVRKDRGPIASQACDVCRQRKQRCDENRPKCGLCTRLKIECNYREPVPTKKDKTMVEILDRVKNIEVMLEQFPQIATGIAELKQSQTPLTHSSLNNPLSFKAEGHTFATTSSHPNETITGRMHTNTIYPHYTASHKILLWPAIQQLLLKAAPSSNVNGKFLERGPVFMVRTQASRPPLSLDVDLQERPFVGMQSLASRVVGGSRTTFPGLIPEAMHQLAVSYFDTFNFLYPFMDRQTFFSETLAKVMSEGFDGDMESVIALLIFALGEVALEGSCGSPVDIYQARPSGIRGGSGLSKPPGVSFFNEAMKKIGSVLTECNLENVQMFCLTALYYQSCYRHLEFWRSMVSASSACDMLITSDSFDWKSPKGDLIKRAYWHCATMETTLHLDIDLPLTSMMNLEMHIEMPLFPMPFCEDDLKGDRESNWQAHSSSVLALRRICVQMQNGISEMSKMDANSSCSEGYTFLTAAGVRQLASQLTQWRGLLPSALQWVEDEPASFPYVQTPERDIENIDPNFTSPMSQQSYRPVLFSTDIDEEPVRYPYAYDIQVATLRTRYYYAKYMVYRPFVYKVLHSPELVTPEDAQNVAECLRSCLMWPILLSPPSRCKRLIPYLFTWSQIFLSILIIVHLSKGNMMLKDICDNMCGERYHAEIDETVRLMLDWIRDLKDAEDPIAIWCWSVLKGIYW
ncbi:hypothetical protein BCIN_01g07910 [Botrytis cinerea B05.10]|uniref:Zn(2)-C6 fungal-type domain-containing protein n=1 Tax=Botryotinia fuckeliana (strain B05.10) TaxID=332648 RepID=A0A384J662_BOTFB|nr:hypothetical protein BCIN_01g07910 [Botrytis cinerea B05.10]ATZ46138.1 hypothetical protein BCIN_01g07910 [Botrytis cinerea B05.10]